MRVLLHVNVLIALLDAAHQHHALAWEWFEPNIHAFGPRARSPKRWGEGMTRLGMTYVSL